MVQVEKGARKVRVGKWPAWYDHREAGGKCKDETYPSNLSSLLFSPLTFLWKPRGTVADCGA